MTYVIVEPCIGVKDASCVDVCPVDCIHATDDDLVLSVLAAIHQNFRSYEIYQVARGDGAAVLRRQKGRVQGDVADAAAWHGARPRYAAIDKHEGEVAGLTGSEV